MPTMNVSLTEKLATFVEGEVATGDYSSASEVVRDALRLLEDRRSKLEALKAAVQVGWDEADRGEYEALDVDELARSIIRETA